MGWGPAYLDRTFATVLHVDPPLLVQPWRGAPSASQAAAGCLGAQQHGWAPYAPCTFFGVALVAHADGEEERGSPLPCSLALWPSGGGGRPILWIHPVSSWCCVSNFKFKMRHLWCMPTKKRSGAKERGGTPAGSPVACSLALWLPHTAACSLALRTPYTILWTHPASRCCISNFEFRKRHLWCMPTGLQGGVREGTPAASPAACSLSDCRFGAGACASLLQI